MKKLSVLFLAVFMIFAYSCKNEGVDKKQLKEELKKEFLTEMENEDVKNDEVINEEVKNEEEVIVEEKVVSNSKIAELIGLKFGGVEPFWSIKFTEDIAYFTPNIGEEEIPLKIKDINVNGNMISMFVSNEQFGYEFSVIVRKENCTDGMSDYTYPYSINLEFPDDNLVGCGGSPK
ncbi:MAG: hypothetical protein JXL97_07585 [Bacteroidales bacterium]|nr:hypothetical protein [Bacteroidales bacterium]